LAFSVLHTIAYMVAIAYGNDTAKRNDMHAPKRNHWMGELTMLLSCIVWWCGCSAFHFHSWYKYKIHNVN